MSSLLRNRFIEDLRIRHYAERTIEIYVYCVAKFAQYFGGGPGARQVMTLLCSSGMPRQGIAIVNAIATAGEWDDVRSCSGADCRLSPGAL